MTWQTILLLLGLAVSVVLARNVNPDMNEKATDKRDSTFQGGMFEEWKNYLELQKDELKIRAEQDAKWAKIHKKYAEEYGMNGHITCNCVTITLHGEESEICSPRGCDPDANYTEDDA